MHHLSVKSQSATETAWTLVVVAAPLDMMTDSPCSLWLDCPASATRRDSRHAPHSWMDLPRAGRALRRDGTLLVIDVKASSRLEENLDHSIGAWGYAVSTLHCMTVSLAIGGEGLGAMCGEQKA